MRRAEVGRLGERARPRDRAEVLEPQLEHDGARLHAGSPQPDAPRHPRAPAARGGLTTGSVTSVSKVVSCPMLFSERSVSMPRGSRPQARSCSRAAPAAPTARVRASSGTSATSPIGAQSEPLQLLLRLAADAPERGHRLRVQERRRSRPAARPAARRASRGSRRASRRTWSPPRRPSTQSGLAVDALAQSRADLPGGAEQSQGARDIEERLVDRERLDQRRDLAEQPHHLRRVVRVPLEVRLEHDRLRAAAQRHGHRHRRVDAVLAGLVGGGGDDRTQRPVPDDDRLADQLGMLEQLDGGEERVHVHVQDVGGRVGGWRVGDLPPAAVLLAHGPILSPARGQHGGRRPKPTPPDSIRLRSCCDRASRDRRSAGR